MRIIPNQSEKRFVTRLMKNGKKRSDLIRFNPRQQSEWIRINRSSDWSKPNCNQNQSEVQHVFWISSEWFALARIQISEWIGIVLIGSDCIGIVLISSEWIPIRYFRQGEIVKKYFFQTSIIHQWILFVKERKSWLEPIDTLLFFLKRSLKSNGVKCF